MVNRLAAAPKSLRVASPNLRHRAHKRPPTKRPNDSPKHENACGIHNCPLRRPTTKPPKRTIKPRLPDKVTSTNHRRAAAGHRAARDADLRAAEQHAEPL